MPLFPAIYIKILSIVKLLRNIRHVDICRAVACDMLFSAGEIVAEPEIKYLGSFLGVGRVDADKAAGRGIHRRQRHHVRIVFTETFLALDGELAVFKLGKDILLLLLVIGKPCLVL